MTVFFQHVGEAGGRRDFPRSIGTASEGVLHFNFEDVEPYLSTLSGEELVVLREQTAVSPEGFQIWGIPSGARRVLQEFGIGDYLLLLEAAGFGGGFAYAGKAIARPTQPCFDLSRFLWGEERYPLVVFLRGIMTSYSWLQFCDQLGYSPNWNPAGQTYRIQTSRLSASSYGSEQGLLSAMGLEVVADSSLPSKSTVILDLIELDLSDEEGRQILREHLIRERSPQLVREFKKRLASYMCCVCGFDFAEKYGELGSNFIEAHHTKAIRDLAPGERVSAGDLVPVCSNCHRMLHRKYPNITCADLVELMSREKLLRTSKPGDAPS